MNHVWKVQEYDEDLAEVLSQQLKISKILSRLLVQRKITAIDQAQDFLNPSLNKLTDPYCLPDMDKAVKRIKAAVALNQKIAVYGDYDVDGICSIVILKECLESLGAAVDYYVPDRFREGYGLNGAAIEMLARQGCNLLITVDCGISAATEVELAGSLGMEVIVTDHHTPPANQPPALAIINPHHGMVDDAKYLCGAGVAFKLARALLEGKPGQADLWLDLVALATIADVVPLIGENRILVKHGLLILEKTARPGLRALMDQNGLGDKALTSWEIGFVLAPRLNSAGRMASASVSVELLTTPIVSLGHSIAVQLEKLNQVRRQVEEAIYQEALNQIKADENLASSLVLIIGGVGWHQGVIGIIASRLVEQFARPCLVITWEGNTGRGSARSIEGFDLHDGLQHCADYLIEYGGHKMAAGLTIDRKQLENFRLCLHNYANRQLPSRAEVCNYKVDLEVQEEDIDQDLFNDIQMLAPFGEGNPNPRLLLLAGEITSPQWVGASKLHLKFRTRSANLDAIAFNRLDLTGSPLMNCNQDIMFELANNVFAGRQKLQLKVRELRSSYRSNQEFQAGYQSQWLKTVIEKIVSELQQHRPVVLVYPTSRSLSKNKAFIEYFLNKDSLQYLHGHLSRSERRRGDDKFKSGQGLVYITTRAYWEYFRSQALLPANLAYVVGLWPSPQSTLFKDLPEQIATNSWPSLDISGHGSFTELTESEPKALVYVNQGRTLGNLERRFPQACKDTHLADIKLKRAIRQQFLRQSSGLLFCDASLIPGHPGNGTINALYLADSPFGSYELAAFADYLLPPDPITLKMSFDRDSIERNRVYLNNRYPLPEMIKTIYEFCCQNSRQLQRYQGKDVQGYICNLADSNFSRLEVDSALRVLADIGLCEPQKSGSIMATNFEMAENLNSLAVQHPFSLEGEAEKLALAEWEAALPNFLEW